MNVKAESPEPSGVLVFHFDQRGDVLKLPIEVYSYSTNAAVWFIVDEDLQLLSVETRTMIYNGTLSSVSSLRLSDG